MRIAFLTNNVVPPREGIGRHIIEVARRLTDCGATPHIIAKGSQTRGWQHGECSGVKVSHFPSLAIRPFHQQLLGRTLQNWVDREGPQFDLLHLHLPLLPDLQSRQRQVITFHSPLVGDTASMAELDLRARLNKLNARFVSRRVEQRHIDRAHRLIAVSQGVSSDLRQHYDLGRKAIDVIHNGVDCHFFQFILGNRRQRRLLYVGRLGYRKGLDRLLDAMALCDDPKLQLDIAGEGPFEARLRRRAVNLGLSEKVNFIGFLDRNQLRERLKISAALINPADYETGPLTVLEAMAAGTPVISTPTSMAAEMGDEPPLIKCSANAPAIAASIERLLANSLAARDRALAARQLVERQFDWSKIVAQLIQHYQIPRRLAA